MPRTATVKRLTFPEGRRVLAISDIHGNRAFFRGLLEKAAFSSRDILVLVGDILEKGPDSLGLLRDILELSQDHTILPVCGNCDGLVLRFFEDDLGDQGFFRVYLPAHPESILRQMAREAGFDRWDDLPRLRECLRRTFPWVWDWLRSLPTILETLLQQGYTFVPISQIILPQPYTIDHTGRQFPAETAQ